MFDKTDLLSRIGIEKQIFLWFSRSISSSLGPRHLCSNPTFLRKPGSFAVAISDNFELLFGISRGGFRDGQFPYRFSLLTLDFEFISRIVCSTKTKLMDL